MILDGQLSGMDITLKKWYVKLFRTRIMRVEFIQNIVTNSSDIANERYVDFDDVLAAMDLYMDIILSDSGVNIPMKPFGKNPTKLDTLRMYELEDLAENPR